jgi:Tfp pilus assembly major pilin PilA
MTDTGLFKLVGGIVVVAIVIGIVSMVGCPQYNVYVQSKAGEAQLAEAESSRKIAIEEANAKLEAAKLLAQAEVERAKGAAEANKIIADGLEGKEEYLRYLWIQNLEEGSNEVIYIPTEAGLPILEAGKRGNPTTSLVLPQVEVRDRKPLRVE